MNTTVLLPRLYFSVPQDLDPQDDAALLAELETTKAKLSSLNKALWELSIEVHGRKTPLGQVEKTHRAWHEMVTKTHAEALLACKNRISSSTKAIAGTSCGTIQAKALQLLQTLQYIYSATEKTHTHLSTILISGTYCQALETYKSWTQECERTIATWFSRSSTKYSNITAIVNRACSTIQEQHLYITAPNTIVHSDVAMAVTSLHLDALNFFKSIINQMDPQKQEQNVVTVIDTLYRRVQEKKLSDDSVEEVERLFSQLRLDSSDLENQLSEYTTGYQSKDIVDPTLCFKETSWFSSIPVHISKVEKEIAKGISKVIQDLANETIKLLEGTLPPLIGKDFNDEATFFELVIDKLERKLNESFESSCRSMNYCAQLNFSLAHAKSLHSEFAQLASVKQKKTFFAVNRLFHYLKSSTTTETSPLERLYDKYYALKAVQASAQESMNPSEISDWKSERRSLFISILAKNGESLLTSQDSDKAQTLAIISGSDTIVDQKPSIEDSIDEQAPALCQETIYFLAKSMIEFLYFTNEPSNPLFDLALHALQKDKHSASFKRTLKDDRVLNELYHRYMHHSTFDAKDATHEELIKIITLLALLDQKPFETSFQTIYLYYQCRTRLYYLDSKASIAVRKLLEKYEAHFRKENDTIKLLCNALWPKDQTIWYHNIQHIVASETPTEEEKTLLQLLSIKKVYTKSGARLDDIHLIAFMERYLQDANVREALATTYPTIFFESIFYCYFTCNHNSNLTSNDADKYAPLIQELENDRQEYFDSWKEFMSLYAEFEGKNDAIERASTYKKAALVAQSAVNTSFKRILLSGLQDMKARLPSVTTGSDLSAAAAAAPQGQRLGLIGGHSEPLLRAYASVLGVI